MRAPRESSGVLNSVSYLSDAELECIEHEVRDVHENVSNFVMTVEQARSLVGEVKKLRAEREARLNRLGRRDVPINALDLYSIHMAVWDGKD